MSLTHRVAVNAFLIHKEKFLLLRRKKEPLLWGPPGGRLEINESPIAGLKREIQEETGLAANVHKPVTTWFGMFGGERLFSVDYLCTTAQNAVSLSGEHSEFTWQSIIQLEEQRNIFLTSPNGFKFEDFCEAWAAYLLLMRKYNELQTFTSNRY